MNAPSGDSGVTSCYRHEDRRSGVICQRCDRPICSECMNTASVGFHCPECVKGGKQQIYRGAPTFDPILTKALIGINALIWLASTIVGGRFTRIAPEFLVDGALFGPLVADGEWYRLVTSGFLHDGIVHIGFNAYAIWIMGNALERMLGRPRFLALYATSLLGGSLGALLIEPDAISVGASGAVFGLFGAMAMFQRFAGMSIWSSGLGPVLALNLFITFAIPRISVGGHLGGLVAGGIIAALYVSMTRTQTPDRAAVGVVVGLGAAFVFLSLLLASNPIF